jgi:hypothetical protein
MCFSIVFHDKS